MSNKQEPILLLEFETWDRYGEKYKIEPSFFEKCVGFCIDCQNAGMQTNRLTLCCEHEALFQLKKNTEYA